MKRDSRSRITRLRDSKARICQAPTPNLGKACSSARYSSSLPRHKILSIALRDCTTLWQTHTSLAQSSTRARDEDDSAWMWHSDEAVQPPYVWQSCFSSRSSLRFDCSRPLGCRGAHCHAPWNIPPGDTQRGGWEGSRCLQT
jgi:hypothetical protein